MELMEQAKRMAEIYKMNSNIEVVFIGGSVSRGWEDRYSDIELFLLWKEPPTDEDRLQPIHQADGNMLAFHPYEDQEWSESYLVDGTKFEISNFLTSTVEEYIQSMKKGDPSLEKQCLVGAIADGLALKGEERFEALRESIFPFPVHLKENLIVSGFDFDGRWQSRKALVHRRDSLILHSVLVDVSKKLIIVIGALNERYIHHPGFKWLEQTCKRMKVQPDCFSDRIHGLLTCSDLGESVRQLESLVAETGQLIQFHCPHLDVEEQLRNVQSERPGVKRS